MAIISMLPSGVDNTSKVFRNTIVRLKSNQWVELDGVYKYTSIIDGISINDRISYKLSPVNITPTEEEEFAFSCITGFNYGINYIEFSASQIPVNNFNIEVYNMVYDPETLYNTVTHLSNIVDSASKSSIPNTLVLRDSNGEIDSYTKYSSNADIADKAKNDELGRSIYQTYATLDSPNLKNYPTSPYPNTVSTNYNDLITNVKFVNDKITQAISELGSMTIKGSVGINGEYTELPINDVRNGYTYVVVSDGLYGGYECTLGDLLVAKHNSPVESDYSGDWIWIPSGDHRETSIRTTSNSSLINIKDTVSVGDVVVGNAAGRIVDESITDSNSTNIPTSKAVSAKIDTVNTKFNYVPSINTISGTNTVYVNDAYPGSISIESIKANKTIVENNKLKILSSITVDTESIDFGTSLTAVSNTVYDSILRANNTLLNSDIECGDWYKEANTGSIKLDNTLTWEYIESSNIFSTTIELDNDLSNIANSVANYNLIYDSDLLSDTNIGFSISSRSDNKYKIYVRLGSITNLTDLISNISTNPIIIIYELIESEKYAEKLSDNVQVKFAKLSLSNSAFTTRINGNGVIELLYPFNKIGSITIRGYNSPQRIMYTLKESTLYMTTK